MAKKVAEVKVMVDNKDAINSTKKYGEEIAKLTEKVAALGDKLSKKETWGPNETFESINKALKKTQKQLDEALQKQEASMRRIGGIDDFLANVEGASYNALVKNRTVLTNSLRNARRETEEEIKEYEQRAKRLQQIRDEIAKRDIDMRGGMTEGRAKQVMKSLDESSYADIKNATETMKKMQAQLEPGSNKWKTYGKQIADATNYLKKWDDQAKRTQMLQATKGDLGKMSDSDLQQQLRYWDGIVNGVGRTNVAVTQYKKVLETLRTEQDKRVGRVMTKVEGDDFGGNIAEMQQRLKLLQDYRTVIDSTKPDAYVRVDAAIEKLTQKIKESQAGFLSYADAMKQAEGLANGTFKGSISDLDKIKKVLEEYKGTLSTSDTTGLEKVNTMLGNIEQKQKELQTGYMSYAQAMDKAGQVMDGSFEGSIADLEKLQKVLTEYRSSLDVKDSDALKDVDTRLESIAQKMQQLRPGFMSFQDALEKAKQISAGAFEGTIEDLDKLQKVLKEGMSAELNISDEEDIKTLKTTTALLDDIAKKQKELADINKREQSESKIAGVSGNIAGSSPAEIEEAIRLAKELQKMNGTSATQYQSLAKFINDAEAQLKKWNEETKQSIMQKQMNEVSKLSKIALEEQKKYWQTMVDGASEGDAALDRYRENLKKVTEEEKRRIQQSAQQTIAEYNTGNWDKTIGDTREAVKQLQEYRNTLRTVGDDNALQEVDKVIEGLTLKTKQAEAGFLSFDEAMKRVADLDHFDGTLEDLEKIQKVLKEGMSKELNLSNQADLDRLKTTTALLDDITKKQKEISQINFKDKAESTLSDVENDIWDGTIKGAQEAIKLLQDYRTVIDSTKPDAYVRVDDAIEKLTQKIKESQAGFLSYADAMKQAEGLANGTFKGSISDLDKIKKVLEEYRGTLSTSDITGLEKVNTALGNIEQKQKELQSGYISYSQAMIAAAQVMNGSFDGSLADLEKLQKVLTEYRNSLDVKDTAGLKDVDTRLEAITKKMQELRPGFISFQDALAKAGEVSAGTFDGTIEDLEKIQKALKEGMESELSLFNPNDIDQMKQAQEAMENIAKKQKELAQLRLSEKAESTLSDVENDIWDGTIKGAQETIKLLQDYRTVIDSTKPDAYVRVDAAIEKLTQKIKESQAGFLSYADAMKQAEGLANGTFKGSISDLDKIKKVLEEYKGTLSTSDTAGLDKVNTALGNIEQKQKELQSGYISYSQAMIAAAQVMNGSFDGSLADLEKLQKVLTEYRNSLDVKDTAGLKDVDTRLEAITKKMQDLRPGFMSFQDALAKAGEVSAGTFDGTIEDLEKIQKTLKEGMESELSLFNPNDINQMKQAQEAMENIANKRKELAQLRLSEKAESTLSDVENDIWDGTIKETQEAIKLLQEYRTTLKTTDADGLKRVDDALDKLGVKTKQAEKGFISLDEALKQAGEVQTGTFKGTIEDLQKVKKTLEELRKTKIEIGDKDGLKKVDEALFVVESKLKDTTKEAVTLDEVLNNLDEANFNQLQMAAKALEEELKNMSESADDFAEKSEKLRNVEKRMDELKKKWETHDNVIMKTAKRLMAYVAVYGGFNEILSQMKELISLNLKLSDSMADVQKTTGLAGVELQELGREIERIDSRTSTDRLYEIAAAAGQIGLKTQQDVLGFTKAANTITVALNELGTEGAANLMKIATLTGEVANYGTEGALMRVGSAINELTANSAATAGPITDFIGRVGGIASASKIAISEMAALGAVTDASAQSIEIAGTSMNKFISALMSNTENIAYAANISVKDLQELINNGQTMEAVVRVLESMQTMSRGAQSALLKELGSEGARMNQYVAALVSNLDMLKEQLAISRDAFEENVSVINEYNVKQESAAGILERMKNSFKDAFVNSRAAVGMVTVLENISKVTSKIVDLLSNSFLTDVAVGIINFTTKLLAWVSEFTPAMIALEAAVARLMLLNVHKWLFGVGGAVSSVVKILKTAVLHAIVALHNSLVALRTSFVTASAGASGFSAVLSGLKGVVMGLWAAFKANPLGWVVTIFSTVVAVFHNLKDEAEELTQAMSDLSKKHVREIQELQALRDALESTETSYEVKASALDKLNSLYSKYLGFQLREIDSYEKKAAALNYVNEKLKEQQKLEEKNRRIEYFTDEFGKESNESLREMEKKLVEIPKIGRTRWLEAVEVINEVVKSGVTDTDEILRKISEHFDLDRSKYTRHRLSGMTSWLSSYVDAYSKYQENLLATDIAYDRSLLNSKHLTYEQLSELAEAHQNDIAALEIAHQKKVQDAEEKGRKISEQEQIAHLQALKRENEQYLETAKKMQEYWKEEDAKKLKDPMVANEDGSVIPSMVGALYGRAASVEAKEYNELLKERNSINEAYLATADKVKKAEEALAAVEAQRKENWETPEEEDAYIASLDKAKVKVEEEKANRDKLYKDLKAANVLMNEQFQELSLKAASSARKQWTDTIETVEAEINSLAIRIAGDPYGKGFNVKSWKDFGTVIENLDTSSVDALAAAYKKLRDESKTITADVEAFNKMFDPKTPKKNLDELNEQVLDWANQIRQELMSRGRGVTGEFLFGEGKEGYDQVLEQLKTHFLKQQKQLRESYLKGLMTGPELKRRLEANNKEFLNARVQLNKLMLGQANSFDQTLYPELAEANLSKIARTIFTAGEEVRAQIEQNLEEDQNAILDIAIQTRENLEKEFTKTSPFRTLDNQFKDTLDNLGLMSSEFEREIVESLSVGATEINKFGNMVKHWDPLEVMGLDQENMEKRFDIIKEYAARSYTVDAEGLRDMMREHKDYDNWIRPMKTEQLEYLLQASRWYYDQELLAVKNYTSQLKKEYDSMYNQLQLKMSDSERASWEIQQLSGKLLAPDLEEGQRKAIIARINELEQIRDDARKRESDKAKSHRNKQEREAKEQMEASISALQAYYNEQEAMIRKNALERGASQATLDRELLKNTLKREKDEIELRKKLLGEASEFDPNANDGYRGVITGTEFFGKNKTNEVLAKQAKQIAVWGKALQDGIRNQIAKGEITIQEALQKERDKIEKVLLEDDFNAKVAEEYLEAIDTLGLLFNIKSEDMKDMDKELGESRLAYMREWAKESYNLNAQQLQDKIEQEAAFSKWRIGRTTEDYEALLIQLRKFHDDQAEAEKKHAERMKRITDARFKSSGQQEESENRIQDSEAKLDMAQRMQEFGVGGEQVVNDYEVELIKQKIAAEEQWLSLLAQETIAKQDMLRQDIEAAERRMALEADETKRRKIQDQINQLKLELESEQNAFVIASNESINKMLELQANATDKYINNFTHYFSYLKEYQEGIDTFAQSMGEGIYGSKEDRQQAAKDLLVSVATTSKNLLQMWLTQLATRRLIDDMEVEQTRATEMRKQAIKLQSLVQDGTLAIGSLEAQAAIAQAENLMDISRGIGKEVAKKGLIGLAIGAAISAALSALLGAAMGGVNKAKSEVAAATGANTGRLATGMLTYAEGNYPVLGNDGNVYNAKYEGSGMKTGIYRGGAHFGIFSEKKPEAIIDGDTTQRLIMNHPDIWKAIVTLSKNGRLDSGMGMRTFATGNINDLARQAQDMEASATTDNSAQMAEMQATMAATQQALAQLTQVLAGGIRANINMYGEDGMYKSMKKAEKYAGRVGYK